jgi:cytochrome b561
LVQGTDTAKTLCDVHGPLAMTFAGLMLLHLLTVSLHLVDFIRD